MLEEVNLALNIYGKHRKTKTMRNISIFECSRNRRMLGDFAIKLERFFFARNNHNIKVEEDMVIYECKAKQFE